MAHVPVLLNEVLEWLRVQPGGAYVDCTVGGGGYAAAILERHPEARVIAIDRDPEAIATARRKLRPYGERVAMVRARFGELGQVLSQVGAGPAAGIVADLGMSRVQLDDAARGFSFQTDGPLDMRMDSDQTLTAARIVNTYGEKPLAELLWQLGGERRAKKIAEAMVRARPLAGTKQLADVIEKAAPRTRHERIHPATRAFQALRIAVNDEIGELERLLEAAPRLLAPAGRFVVVSFHSLEDGTVKRAFREWASRKVLQILTKHVIRPGEAEIAANPASRSAKLRAAEKRVDSWR